VSPPHALRFARDEQAERTRRGPGVTGVPSFTTRPELAGTFGMVASTHWLATAAGMAVLEAGGNAFDAAAAAGFALQVVEPHMSGPGGDMSLLFARAGDDRPVVLSGQGPAPRAATREHFADLGLALIPGAGPLAAAVPGQTDAWFVLLRDYGSLPLREILGYAIEYAGGGHPMAAGAAATIADTASLFRDAWPTSADLYLPNGRAPLPGERFRNPALAATWLRLLEESEAGGGERADQVERARVAWGRGFVAEAIDSFARRPFLDSSGEAHPGLVTADDLAAYESPYEIPVTYDFRGWTICKTGPWGQGPVLLQQLALLDGFDDDALRPGSVDLVHTAVECAKLAFADREAWYGDVPDVPLELLLSPEYSAARRGLVGRQASMELRPGSPGGRRPVLPASVAPGAAPSRAFGIGDPTLGPSRVPAPAPGDTCHVDVVDRHGNLVSATPSGGWLQSSPVIPELGFPLGSRLQMLWLEPGLPASLAPGRRPRTTLTPSIALRDGVPTLAFGTPGGDQQDQWQLVFLLGHVLGGLNLQEAIDAPAWHTTAFPSSFYPRETSPGEVVVESRLGTATIAALRRRGHRVVVSEPWSLGRLSAVSRDPRTGLLHAAANPRGMQGYAAGR
jgi:gamma-glutamyltranspeptidase / glutathione hydrolase